MKAWRLTGLFVVAVWLLLAAVVYAQAGAQIGRSCGCVGYAQKSVPEDVRLTDAQKAKIEKMRASYAEALASIRDKIRDLDLAIREEIASGNKNPEVVRDLKEERAQAYEELYSIRDQINKEVFSILTDKQKVYYTKAGGCLCSEGCNCGFDCTCGLNANCAHKCSCQPN